MGWASWHNGWDSFLIPLLLANYCVVVLDPSRKLVYFQKHWPSETIVNVEDTIQNRVCPLPSIFIITSSITLYASSSNASTVCKAIQLQSQHTFARSPQHASQHTLTSTILTPSVTLSDYLFRLWYADYHWDCSFPLSWSLHKALTFIFVLLHCDLLYLCMIRSDLSALGLCTITSWSLYDTICY